MKIFVVVLTVLCCIAGAVVAIINMIRTKQDPPFTIVEKRETIEAESKKRIEQMIEDMKKD